MATKITETKSSKSLTMADLLAKSNSSAKNLSLGQKVKGTVVQILGKSLIVDIGGKAEGVVSEKGFAEAREYISKLKVGDEVNATVLVPEMRDGSTLLSLRDSVSDSHWKALEEAYKTGGEVAVLAKNITQSGIMVDANGVSGFIPFSQMSKELQADKDQVAGKYFKVKVIEVDRQKNKLVLSEREVTEAEDIKVAKVALEKIKEGDILEGEITTISNFGAFVKLNLGTKQKIAVEGLVHISEISWGKVAHPSDSLKVGQKVKVMVLGKSESAKNVGKLSLSIKNATEDPWVEADKKYKKDDKIKGNVTKVTDFGVFVELEPGVEGLIHITKIAPGKKFSTGDEVSCYIEEIDTKSRKISLGLILTSIPVGYK